MSNAIEKLKELGNQLWQDDETRREAARVASKRAEDRETDRLARRAGAAVEKLLGAEVLESLQPWRRRGTHEVTAAIGIPTEGVLSNESWLPGDKDGQDGELLFDEYTEHGEVRYRPRFNNGSAVIRDREHFARMLSKHTLDG